MPKARCCRDTVYEAILALEAMGAFSNDSGLMDIDRRNQRPVRLLDCCGIGRRIRFFFKNSNQSCAIDDDHKALRSSMISRGERGSRTGMAVISAPTTSTAIIRHNRPGATRGIG
jgi:hypothetical protein